MNNNIKGIINSQITALSYTSYGVFSRLIGSHLDPIYQITTRYIPSSIFSFILILIKGVKLNIHIPNKFLFFLHLVSGPIVNIFYFFMIVKLPLGVGMFLFYGSSQIFNFVCSIFNNQFNKKSWFAILLSIIGIFILSFEQISNFDIKYIIFALLAGVFFSVTNISGKSISEKVDLYVLNI